MKRVEKYTNESMEEVVIPSRTKKNENIYQQVETEDLDYKIGTNARVIGESENNLINVDKIKEILEKNYHEYPKRSQVKFDVEEEPVELELEKTREYDINTILEKAKEGKEVDYEEERLKKVRDTQYNILKNLNFDNPEEEVEIKSSSAKTNSEILSLINTITENELKDTQSIDPLDILTELKATQSLDPLDILTELKGNDNTALLGANDFTNELETVRLEKKEDTTEVPINEKKLEDSFYSKSMSFNKEDFEDLYDGKDNNWIFKVIAVIIALLLCGGILFFLNSFLNLGWF